MHLETRMSGELIQTQVLKCHVVPFPLLLLRARNSQTAVGQWKHMAFGGHGQAKARP